MSVFALPVLVAVIASVVYLVRNKDPRKRGRFLRSAGLVLLGLFTLFFALFAIGETFSDPGGWAAAGYIAMWLVPLAAVAALAWFRPGLATVVLAALLIGLLGIQIWAAISPDRWSSYEDSHGPIRTIITFAIAAPLVVCRSNS